MKSILNRQIKYYTKEGFKLIGLVGIALFIIITIILTKFNIAVEVIISGKEVGYIENKKAFEEKINNEVLTVNGLEIASVEIAEQPQYKLTLLSKEEQTNEDEILSKIKNDATKTYVRYAVMLENKQKAILNNLKDAEDIVTDIEKKYGKNINVGIQKLYSIDDKEYKTVSVKTASTDVTEEIEDKIQKEEAKKSSTVNGVYLATKPISGTITSRFGNRESIRSHAHTGLDIAAPRGTTIKSATEGTVIFSGYQGSYGNLIKVSCKNGVVVYYGHCSKLYASVGQKVKPGDAIAAVGSTGNSTGNHLHFEIQINGTSVNPQKYIYK